MKGGTAALARTKSTGTNSSASNNHESKQSMSALREQNKLDMERQRQNFEKAIEGLKKLRDPNKKYTSTIAKYDRETIRNLLQNPANSEDGLRKAALYLYYRSQLLYRIIHWYADMWDLRCRTVVPDYNLTKDNDPNKVMAQYEKTLNLLERYNIQSNWHDVAIRCYLEDVCYVVFYRGDESSMMYILDPSECRIDGRYDSLDFSYSIDASKWKSAQRREIAEWLGEPFTSILREYDRTGEKWIHMPDEWGAAFKFNADRIDAIIPPFAPLLQDLAGQNDLADLQAIKDEASVYRLLLIPMKILSGAHNSDDFEVSPDLLLEYYQRLVEILPDYVAAAPIPGEVTNNNVIDFSTTSVDKDIDRLGQSRDVLLSTSGGGAVLNSSQLSSTAAFNAWLKAESEYAISSLLPQIQGFTNRMLSYDMSGKPCKVEYFEVTVYTKQELAENLLKLCQYSFSDRLALQTLYGFSEKTTLSLQYLENTILGLPNQMIYPLNSSYTQSSVDTEVGRPMTPDNQLTDSGERSRNA